MKEQILKLKSEGKIHTEIAKIVGCSKSTVSYYCCPGSKERHHQRGRKNRQKKHPYQKKLEHFLYDRRTIKPDIIYTTSSKIRVYRKITDWHRDTKTRKCEQMKFTIEDIIQKFGEKPTCYLTGVEIDIYDTKSYEFDHIIPKSRGGTNDLDNLGICTKAANQAKRNMTPDEFINLCKLVVKHNGDVES